MTTTEIVQYQTTNDSNSDSNGYNIANGCSPANIDKAMRAIMGALARWSQAQIGHITAYAGGSPPSWHLACNGQAVSRTTYSLLFGVIGTSWGSGDGATTFNVPDLRGYATVGADSMFGGTSAGRFFNYGPGNPIGATSVTLSVGNLASHSHAINDPGHAHSVNDPSHNHGINDPAHYHGGVLVAGAGSGNTVASGNIGGSNTSAAYTGITINNNTTGISIYSATTGITVNSNGSNTPFSIVQPSVCINFIIYAGA